MKALIVTMAAAGSAALLLLALFILLLVLRWHQQMGPMEVWISLILFAILAAMGADIAIIGIKAGRK